MMRKPLILIELNEINFDVANQYVKGNPGLLPSFEKLMSLHNISTVAEENYEELEPWIQWPSVHMGKDFSEHGIFRLGDVVNNYHRQFFEILENAGFKVGAISPMNASNAMVAPSYFIPDPWTRTKSDGSMWGRSLSKAISQAVNDNSQSKIEFSSLLAIVAALFYFVSPVRYFRYFIDAIGSRGKAWRKALFLDKLLDEIHRKLLRKSKPDFSVVFLNAGAHIQHHYFYCSPYVRTEKLKNPDWYISDEYDPMKEMFQSYDRILDSYLSNDELEVIVATGLSQKPYDRLKFYYRLKDHARFLTEIGIHFASVQPRMTRDFLILFSSEQEVVAAKNTLDKILVDDSVRLFDDIEVRDKSLFVTLTYPSEITNETSCHVEGREYELHRSVCFVAIKNGMYQSNGYAFFTPGVSRLAPPEKSHVKTLHHTVLNYFDVEP
ncbi:MAG: hypothetical protein ACI8PD_002395 [Nitrospinales bacterium]|jgi:hypothetical protein